MGLLFEGYGDGVQSAQDVCSKKYIWDRGNVMCVRWVVVFDDLVVYTVYLLVPIIESLIKSLSL